MNDIESAALTKNEAITAWQLMGFVVQRKVVLGSTPITNGFARKRADKLVHAFGHMLGDMTEQRSVEVSLGSFINDPKDLRFVTKAVALEIEQRQSFAERNPNLTQNPVWQAKDIDFAGLQSVLSSRLS